MMQHLREATAVRKGVTRLMVLDGPVLFCSCHFFPLPLWQSLCCTSRRKISGRWSETGEGLRSARTECRNGSETYIKASITNRTNVLKYTLSTQENTLDFMRTYGILLPLQKLYVLRKAENRFSCTTIGLATNYTDPQPQSRFLQTSYLYSFSSYISTEETHIIQEIQWS